MSRTNARRFLAAAGRSLGMIGGLGLAAMIVLVSHLTKESWEAGASGDRTPRERDVVQAELLDFWTSEGFADLARTVAAPPEAPSWEDVRALMKARGCTNLRYSVRVRWTLDDGATDDLTYTRRPYEEPWNAAEFLLLLRGGPESTGLFPPSKKPIIRLDREDGPPTAELIIEQLLNSGSRNTTATSNVSDSRPTDDRNPGKR